MRDVEIALFGEVSGSPIMRDLFGTIQITAGEKMITREFKRNADLRTFVTPIQLLSALTYMQTLFRQAVSALPFDTRYGSQICRIFNGRDAHLRIMSILQDTRHVMRACDDSASVTPHGAELLDEFLTIVRSLTTEQVRLVGTMLQLPFGSGPQWKTTRGAEKYHLRRKPFTNVRQPTRRSAT
jgi:hypothetical protein